MKKDEKKEDNVKMTLSSIASIWPRTQDLMWNLFLVYFFEYNCITCFADRFAEFNLENADESHKDDYFIANYYIVLNLSYQLGVFMSRSSLRFFPVQNLTALTILQGINFVVMLINSLFLREAILSLWVLCPFFVWIGLMGGCSYVNIMHNFLKRDILRKEEKEIAISTALVLISVATMLSAVFAIVMT